MYVHNHVSVPAHLLVSCCMEHDLVFAVEAASPCMHA